MSNGRLKQKKALVTGGAQGVGAGIAIALAREGARVLVTDRNEPGAQAVAERINQQFGEGSAYACRHDVTQESDWRDAIAFARECLGGLSVLVNNAGIVVKGTVEDLDLATWRQAMAVNADSAFLGCKYALPLMRENQPASIVNISSISALVASHNMVAYNASKAAMLMVTKSVALYCARKRWAIRCNSIHPVFIRTPLLDGLVGDHTDQTNIAKLSQQVPIGRIGEVEDVASAAVYLASDESAMMTASEIKLDGGLSAM